MQSVCGHIFFTLDLVLTNTRPKAQIMHNKGSPYEATPTDNFFEVEIEVDKDSFVGDLDAIQEGKFVSFKYLGEFGSGGPPVNPKISSTLRWFNYDICYMCTYTQLEMTYKAGNNFCMAKQKSLV